MWAYCVPGGSVLLVAEWLQCAWQELGAICVVVTISWVCVCVGGSVLELGIDLCAGE